MKTRLIAAVTALSLATAAPSFAGENWNHWSGGGWNGVYHHGDHWRGNGSNWIWGAPLLGAAVAATVLAAPYYGYGGYGYAPYYSYPTPLVPALTRWCQNPYGVRFLC